MTNHRFRLVLWRQGRIELETCMVGMAKVVLSQWNTVSPFQRPANLATAAELTGCISETRTLMCVAPAKTRLLRLMDSTKYDYSITRLWCVQWVGTLLEQWNSRLECLPAVEKSAQRVCNLGPKAYILILVATSQTPFAASGQSRTTVRKYARP